MRLRFGLVACCVLSQLRLYWNCSHKICREGETNDAINSLTKKWTANLVYCFEDFDNETHSQRLSAYIDQKPLDKFKEANLIELNKERDRWKLTNKGIDLLESIKNIYQSGRIFPLPLPFRHYYVNCKLEYNMEVKDGNVYDGLRETVLKDRSRDVRRKVAEYLEYKGKTQLQDRDQPR